jgi:hypothetical protein
MIDLIFIELGEWSDRLVVLASICHLQIELEKIETTDFLKLN